MPAERTPKTATTTAKKAPKKGKQDGQPKEKRPPTPYNLFVKEQMPIWKDANPGRPVKEAMQGIAALWADSDLNPNKGKPPKSKPKSKKTKSSTTNDADEDQHTASSSVAGSSSAVPSSDHDY
ncbi:hypothetical protein FRC04_006305 [Tulasnella sp. 424]|nr:hypothetical protein FRC04_006305 [Tulasnella sp. 424]KAG8980359.1 hypothetical protein FRC05_005990 [Tulasnella sp. 425]